MHCLINNIGIKTALPGYRKPRLFPKHAGYNPQIGFLVLQHGVLFRFIL